ncbi:MAG: D-alanyl-D-alanine carboxypeptidase/D-alanyl-D-alanine-endopeptidase [bacterium]|nr:D-alanyl-D-alanine carboxypeptidase/D-alanyl-D-alanine-endopeptidase [bacterium]MBU1917560.1 D-alanyl-D-alanine carboxypeptidase/D-alanyl-D-alanine-endopeptidase [bacterium]
MLRKTALLLLTIFLLTPQTSQANETSLNKVIKDYSHKGTQISVAVHDARKGNELYTHNSHNALNPASTMKVITSVVALNTLGGWFAYETSFTTDAISKGTAYNLYIKGTGDPSFVEERLWRVAKELKVRGINNIEGNLIIDNSLFNDFNFSGKEENNSRAYNAKLSPFAVNFNSFAVVARNENGHVDVHIDPPTSHFDLKSNVKPKGEALSIQRNFQQGIEHVQASGGVTKEKVKYANVSDPVQYAGTTFLWVLKQLDISFKGKIRSGIAKGTKTIITDKSKALSLILRDLNKFSNNFTAEMVLKTLAAQKLGSPGSTEKGTLLLKRFMQEQGLDSTEYTINNGSGLSRNNRLSAHALNTALMAAYKNTKIRSDLISSFSIAGTDGTLRSRLRDPRLKGNVKAKTGTLNDTAALSGFIEAKSGKMLAFTILVNGPAAGSGKFYALQEKILLDTYESF